MGFSLPLIFLLKKMDHCTQLLEHTHRDLLFLSGDSIKQSRGKDTMGLTNPSHDVPTTIRQSSQCVPIILGIKAAADESFRLKLLDQTGNRGPIKQQRLLQIGMPDLPFLRNQCQKVVASLTHAKVLQKGLPGFSVNRRHLIKQILLKGIHHFFSKSIISASSREGSWRKRTAQFYPQLFILSRDEKFKS
jgi:hypothetical protein